MSVARPTICQISEEPLIIIGLLIIVHGEDHDAAAKNIFNVQRQHTIAAMRRQQRKHL